MKCNFDTGAADTALPKSQLGSEIIPTDTTFRTASGELVPGYGSGIKHRVDENGKSKKPTSEFTDVHKVLVSASAVHQKGHFTWLESGGGYVISNSSRTGKELKEVFERITHKYGTHDMLPLWEEMVFKIL